MANAASGPLRIRRDVWKLPPGDTTLEWYGKAVAELQTRPISDPTSWRYQAAIHEYNTATDPFRSPNERLQLFPAVAPRLPVLFRADRRRRGGQARRPGGLDAAVLELQRRQEPAGPRTAAGLLSRRRQPAARRAARAGRQ